MSTTPASPSPPTRRADLVGRRVLVMGLARSGASAARFAVDAGARVTVYDRQPASALAASVAALGDRRLTLALAAEPAAVRRLLAAADLVVTSPSISAQFPTTEAWLREALADAEAHGTPVVSEVDLFLRLTRARVCAVTGTKGKTTTASLIDAILTAAGRPHVLGGNIGTPLIELADRLDPDTWAVLELSELQLPTISRGAEVAVYTNIAADHLDRHPSVEAYRAVKARLAELSAAAGAVVLNRDDPGCVALADRLPEARIHWYGLEAAMGVDAWVADGWVILAGEPILPVADLPLPGRHMVRNVLAAAVGSRLAGADPVAVAAGVRGFGGVPHRLEPIAELAGVSWVNDSQATIPLAAIAALDAYSGRGLVVIAGGQGKGLDYSEFADALAGARAAVLIGQTADELERLIGGRIEVVRAAGMDEAVTAAARIAQAGDVVLLAPAAASFDQFADYAARGDAFRTAVQRLGPAVDEGGSG